MPLVSSFFDSEGRGEFSLTDLSLTFINPPAVDFGSIRHQASSEKERMDEWMSSTAYFHELRHYHDLVGSTTGIAVFLEATRCVDLTIEALHKVSK